MKVGVCILQWNHSNLTKRLLKDLIQIEWMQIAICDNGSENYHFKSLRRWLGNKMIESGRDESFPKAWDIQLIRNRYNSGFGAGMNECIKELKNNEVTWFWVLNNDTQLTVEMLHQVRISLKGQEPGIYGGHLVDSSRNAESGAIRFNKYLGRIKRMDISSDVSIRNDWYIDGASYFLHIDVVEKVGLFDQELFFYGEEIDYRERIKIVNLKYGLLNNIKIFHERAGSSSSSSGITKSAYHATWSLLYIYRKHFPYLFPVLVVKTVLRPIFLLVVGRGDEIKPSILALIHFFIGKNRDTNFSEIVSRDYYLR